MQFHSVHHTCIHIQKDARTHTHKNKLWMSDTLCSISLSLSVKEFWFYLMNLKTHKSGDKLLHRKWNVCVCVCVCICRSEALQIRCSEEVKKEGNHSWLIYITRYLPFFNAGCVFINKLHTIRECTHCFKRIFWVSFLFFFFFGKRHFETTLLVELKCDKAISSCTHMHPRTSNRCRYVGMWPAFTIS